MSLSLSNRFLSAVRCAYILLVSGLVMTEKINASECRVETENPVYTDCRIIPDHEVRRACEDFDHRQSHEWNLDNKPRNKIEITQGEKMFRRFQYVNKPQSLPELIKRIDGRTALILDPACGEYTLNTGDGVDTASHCLLGVARPDNSLPKRSSQPMEYRLSHHSSGQRYPIIRLSGNIDYEPALYSVVPNDAAQLSIITNVRFLVDSDSGTESVIEFPAIRFLVLDGVSLEPGQSTSRFTQGIDLTLSDRGSKASIVNSYFKKSLVSRSLVMVSRTDNNSAQHCGHAFKFAGNTITGGGDASIVNIDNIHHLVITGNKEVAPDSDYSDPLVISMESQPSCAERVIENNLFRSSHSDLVTIAETAVDNDAALGAVLDAATTASLPTKRFKRDVKPVFSESDQAVTVATATEAITNTTSYSKNLVINPSANNCNTDGWNHVAGRPMVTQKNDHTLADDSDRAGNDCSFSSPGGWSSMSQTIDLIESGFSASHLDTSPKIISNELFRLSLPEAQEIRCSVNMQNFRAQFSSIIRDNLATVRCDACKPGPCYIYGTNDYTPRSSLCCAAIHSGAISPKDGTDIAVFQILNQKKYGFRGRMQHGIRSSSTRASKSSYFSFVKSRHLFQVELLDSAGDVIAVQTNMSPNGELTDNNRKKTTFTFSDYPSGLRFIRVTQGAGNNERAHYKTIIDEVSVTLALDEAGTEKPSVSHSIDDTQSVTSDALLPAGLLITSPQPTDSSVVTISDGDSVEPTRNASVTQLTTTVHPITGELVTYQPVYERTPALAKEDNDDPEGSYIKPILIGVGGVVGVLFTAFVGKKIISWALGQKASPQTGTGFGVSHINTPEDMPLVTQEDH